jgi:hypothetical protein
MSTIKIEYGRVFYDFEVKVNELLAEAERTEARALATLESAKREEERQVAIYRSAGGFEGLVRGNAIAALDVCRWEMGFARDQLRTERGWSTRRSQLSARAGRPGDWLSWSSGSRMVRDDGDLTVAVVLSWQRVVLKH